jgi:drug/metabolite transporter (DMT)-like permease
MMSVPAAYLGIVLIWATTPLAIKWSGEEAGFLLGVTLRMGIGYAVCLLLLFLLRIDFPWHREARQAYLAAGLGMFGAMLSVYWGAQYIPSGLVSVIFGLSPILIGVFAMLWLDERSFSVGKLLGITMALGGLVVIFLPQGGLAGIAPQGVLAVLMAVSLHSLSAVWVKRIGGTLHPMSINCGALSIAVPLYLAVWWLFDGSLPAAALGERSLGAILYLALFGTVLGFNLYFYVMKRVSAAALSLVTLITPVLALFIGQGLNGEVITPQVWLGTGAILVGLFSYQWGGRAVLFLRRVAVRG